MQYQLSNTHKLDAEQIRSLIEHGATVRIFKYHIGLLIGTYSTLSPAILIKNDKELAQYKLKYNLRIYLFGLWAVTGILRMIQNIRFNNAGDWIFMNLHGFVS